MPGLQEAITKGYHEGRGLLRFGPRLYLERKRTLGVTGKACPWYMPGYGPISAGFAIGLILAQLTLDQQKQAFLGRHAYCTDEQRQDAD